MNILTVQSNGQEWRGFWNSHQKHIAAFVLALAVDTISTIHFMTATGPEQEFHPVVRMAGYVYGPVLGPVLAAFYKALAAVLVVIYSRKLAAPLFTIAAIVYLFAGFYNYFAVDLYLKGLMPWLPF